MSVPRCRYRRRSRKGVRPPRTQAARGCETQRVSRVAGIDDAHRRGYRPHSLKQRLKKRPGGVRNMTTPAEGDTGPTHSTNSSMLNGMSFQRGRYRRHPWKGVQTLHTQAAAAACETEWAPHRDRYRRHSRKGVQAPCTRIEVEKAFTAFGTDDARERGYMPHPLKQRKIVKLYERPARSVLTTLAEGGTAPTHSSRKRM